MSADDGYFMVSAIINGEKQFGHLRCTHALLEHLMDADQDQDVEKVREILGRLNGISESEDEAFNLARLAEKKEIEETGYRTEYGLRTNLLVSLHTPV